MDNKRSASGQQADTYKNDKNDKNEKNEKTRRRDDFYLSSEQKEIQRIRKANEEALARWLAEGD